MKCNNCNAEWSVSAAMSTAITSCPFCGKPLIKPNANNTPNIQTVVKEIIQHSGIEMLRDGERTLAMFSDLASQLRREKIMFSCFVQCEENCRST